MHAWLRNTVMRLRFIKPRSQVAATRRRQARRKKRRSNTRDSSSETTELFSRTKNCALFRQDNSSFSFLAQRVRLGFSSSLPDLAEGRKNARDSLCQAHVGDVTMIHMRKEIRLVGAKREKGYRYRNPGKNLRRARLTENYL